jgi:hypothetical protein
MTIAGREKIVRYFLFLLIVSFFVFPLFTFYCFDCKFHVSQKIGSLLLFFFR